MALQADFHSTPLSHKRSLLQRVADQNIIFVLRRPRSLDALVGVDHRHSDLAGNADGHFQIFAVHFWAAKRSVGLEPRDCQACLVACVLDAIWIIEHRHGVEVARLAHEFAAEVNHRLDVLVAHRSGVFDSPFKWFVAGAGVFGVQSNLNLAHEQYLLWLFLNGWYRLCRRHPEFL